MNRTSVRRSVEQLLYSVMEKTKPRSILDHLSVALLLLSKGANVCVRVCVCGYPHVENYFRLHSAGTRNCDPTLSRFVSQEGLGTRLVIMLDTLHLLMVTYVVSVLAFFATGPLDWSDFS